MTTPQQSRSDLAVVTGAAVADAVDIAGRVDGTPEARRLVLLDSVPALVDYYASGAAVLASDFYDERRELAGVKKTYTTELVINDRVVKIRRAVAWASEPMFAPMTDTLERRLEAVVQTEVARAYRDTITGNRQNDPASVGWRRVTNVCCKFCRMLADRGAVYKQATARFAAHPNCDCTAEPVFEGQVVGPEATALQYMASKKTRTPTQRQELRDYLNTFYADLPG